MSSRPTGYRRSSVSIRSVTVGRPWGSLAVDTTPAGLLSAYTTRLVAIATGLPSTATASSGVTSRAGSVTVSPPTVTRPARMISSAARRDATPAAARYLARRIACHHRAVDLNLL